MTSTMSLGSLRMAAQLTGQPERDHHTPSFRLSFILLGFGSRQRPSFRCGLELHRRIADGFIAELNKGVHIQGEGSTLTSAPCCCAQATGYCLLSLRVEERAC